MARKIVHIDIDGMSCGHCVKAVREALERLDGVKIREVVIGKAVVEVDESKVPNAQVAGAIDDTGYLVRSIA